MGTTRGVEEGNERGFICVWLKWVWLSKQTSVSLAWFLRAQAAGVGGSSGDHRSAGAGVGRQRTGELTGRGMLNQEVRQGDDLVHVVEHGLQDASQGDHFPDFTQRFDERFALGGIDRGVGLAQ